MEQKTSKVESPLARLRKRCKKTQKQVAHECRISRKIYQLIEMGIGPYPMGTLRKRLAHSLAQGNYHLLDDCLELSQMRTKLLGPHPGVDKAGLFTRAPQLFNRINTARPGLIDWSCVR